MIEFPCKSCGQKLNVEEKHSGKRIKCPKCGSVGVVPDNSDKIKFHCENCGQSISVPQIHAGKRGKCPKCKTPIVVPSLEREPAGAAPPGHPIPSDADEDSYEDESDLPEEGEGVDRRLIIAICGAAAVLVVGLIILVAVILPSGSEPVEEPAVSSRQGVSDEDLRSQPSTGETQPTQPFVQEFPRDKVLPQKIAFSSDRDGDYEIYVMNADGSGLKRLTDNADGDLFPSWSPGARQIAFESRKDGNPDICVMNADGSKQANLTNNSSRHHVPSWSPDGQKIVFYSYDDEDYEIQVMNSDGSGLKRLTDNHTHDMTPSWSPDGTRITFCSERDGNFEIYVMNADGGEQTRLTDNAARDMGPAWSPDGRWITFVSGRDENHEIYAMNPDGTEQRRLTDNPARDGNPSWSPDGKQIAFVSERDGNREIYVMNADGSEQTRLTDNPAGDSWPAWSPVLPSRSQPATPGKSYAAGSLDLKLRLKPGQKHKLQIVKEINSSQTTRGRQFDEEYINTMGLEIEVEQVDNSGVAWLKVTYLTIHEKITDARRGQLAPVMGYTFEYDSTKPETAVSYMNYGPLFTAMIGQSFRARVTSEGEIVELEGLAEMYQEMAELVVENEDEAIRQRMAKASAERIEERAKISIDQRNQHYGSREKRVEAKRESLDGSGHSAKGLIREMLGNVIMPFPGEPVGIGDSWLGKTPLFSVGAGSIGLDNCAYTLKESKQSAVLVDFGSKIEVDDELYAGERGSPGSMTIALAGSCQGSLEIDPSSGWMLHKTVTMHYSGERRMAPTQRAPQGLTTVMSMENVTTVKPIE